MSIILKDPKALFHKESQDFFRKKNRKSLCTGYSPICHDFIRQGARPKFIEGNALPNDEPINGL